MDLSRSQKEKGKVRKERAKERGEMSWQNWNLVAGSLKGGVKQVSGAGSAMLEKKTGWTMQKSVI